MPEYVVVAYGPDHYQIGDYIARKRDDAIDYAEHFLDQESRDGASVTITVVDSGEQQNDPPI